MLLVSVAHASSSTDNVHGVYIITTFVSLYIAYFFFFIGKRPTIPQLIDFKTKDGNINVAKRIGMNHSTFGLLLLDDKTRTIMPAIVAECFNNATNINMEVLGRWVQGQGIGPVNWATLIETLKKGGCPGLACDIESNLDLNV